MSMSMSLSVVPGTSIEGIEMPMLALGKEENIKVSTFAIGTTGSKGAEKKSEEDIGAASSKKAEKMPKEEKKAKSEKIAKSEKKRDRGRKLARDNVGNRRALQQAYISMSMSMSFSVVPSTSIEGVEMPSFALGKEENIKVSTFTIGTTGLKGAETKSEEDIGAASSKKREKMPKEEKKAKPEKKAKSEKIAKSEKKRDRRV